MRRIYKRDWRGRFARVSGGKKRKKQTTREKLATNLYAKRSEMLVSAKSSLADLDVAERYEPADYIMRATLDHTRAMELIEKMDPDEYADYAQRSINAAETLGEARLIFRIRHGNRAQLNGFDNQYYDKKLTLEALHTMDRMMTRFPEVQIDEINTQPVNHFRQPTTLAHAGRRPNMAKKPGDDQSPSIGMVEINDMYLQFPEQAIQGDKAAGEAEFTWTDRVGNYGVMGSTLVHEFGHLIDYTAYEGQHAQKHWWMNSRDDAEVRRLAVELIASEDEIDRLIAKHGTGGIQGPHPSIVAMQNKRRELMASANRIRMTYEKEEYPTIAQGRNGSVRKAINRAFNRDHGRPEHSAVSPKQGDEIMAQFIRYITNNTSQYSVEPNAPSHLLIRNVINDEGQPVERYLQKRMGVDRDGKIYWNYPEIIAESFADVEMNGDGATEISKEIHAQLLWQLEQGNGGMKARYQSTKSGKGAKPKKYRKPRA